MNRAISSALHLWQRFTFTRYLAASVVALAIDVAVFTALHMLGLYAGLAGAIGYTAGIIVHWIISAQIVFTGRAKKGSGLHLQKVLFAGSALLGLAITFITISMLSSIGVPALYAKIAAVGISFFAVFATREFAVFK